MKKSTHFLLTILFTMSLLTIIGCSDRALDREETALNDEQLIQAIQMATNKQDISMDQLPSASRNVLEQHYSESYAELSQIAPELGYEITMRREAGSRVGECSQAYFNLNGRELRSERDDRDRDGRDRRECFEFVLPVTFIMPDGSTITIETREDWELIRLWYEEHPDVRERPALQYPVEIVFVENDAIVTINNDEELRAAYARCDDGDGRDRDGDDRDGGDCFDFVLPVTWIMPDGSTITIETEEDWDLIRLWYEEHRDVRERPALQYPVEIVFVENDAIVTINNDEEMRAAYALCDDRRDDDGGGDRP